MRIQPLLKFYFSLVFFFILISKSVLAEEVHLIPTDSENEIITTIYKAKGNTLFLWLYSEAGPQKTEEKIIRELINKNIEVWRVDLFSSHFLPVAASSMDRIPDTDFSQLIEYAYQKTGKKIIPVTTGRGSLPLLRGAHLWQTTYPDSTALTGVILMSPKFYIETPDPGVEAKLQPIVEQTNLPIFILQPKKSPWYWKLDKTIPALEKSGSDVFVKRIKGVRDRYYFRPDADKYEKKISTQLPKTLKQAAKSLIALPYKKRKAVISHNTKLNIQTGKKERRLKSFRGNPNPPTLRLPNLKDKVVDLKDLKGKVVLVNFWASWCPPCVHEMPSMQRLQNRFFSKGFTILGVNMAEDKKTVQQFLDTKVDVQFPILFDENGAALKSWGVFAFPTSYIVDKQGKIRYAIFGGVDWEQESIIRKIEQLVNE